MQEIEFINTDLHWVFFMTELVIFKEIAWDFEHTDVM